MDHDRRVLPRNYYSAVTYNNYTFVQSLDHGLTSRQRRSGLCGSSRTNSTTSTIYWDNDSLVFVFEYDFYATTTTTCSSLSHETTGDYGIAFATSNCRNNNSNYNSNQERSSRRSSLGTHHP